MKTKQQKKIITSLMLIVIVLCCFTTVVVMQWPDSNLHIVMCDVGQGDAILLTQGFTQVLIDAGLKDEAILQCLREYMPFWDRQLDWIVPSHLDADHIGGFAAILERFSVLNILTSREKKQTADFARFEEAVLREQEEGAVIVPPRTGAFISAPAAWKLTILYEPDSFSSTKSATLPPLTETQLWDDKRKISLKASDSNNRSIVLSLQYGQVKLLLMGDLEEIGEQALVESHLVTEHTILKVGHHGSKSSSSLPFLAAVQPEVVLISVGKNNKFGHPSSLTLAHLREVGAKQILRTDELGTVELISDGLSVWLNTNDH